MLISPLLYIKWFSVDVLISVVNWHWAWSIYSFVWELLKLPLSFWVTRKKEKRKRIQIVSELFSALSWPAGHQAKLDIPGDRVRSIRLRGRHCCAAKEAIANTRFVRKMHYLAWEVLSRWPGRHSPSDSSWKSPFNSSDPSGLSRAAWQNVQVLVSLGLLSVGDAKLMPTKESVYGGEASQKI